MSTPSHGGEWRHTRSLDGRGDRGTTVMMTPPSMLTMTVRGSGPKRWRKKAQNEVAPGRNQVLLRFADSETSLTGLVHFDEDALSRAFLS